MPTHHPNTSHCDQTHIRALPVAGRDFYAAIFEQSDGRAWAARHGLTSDQYQQAFDELVGQGFRPVRVSGYSVGGEDRYAAIFEQSDGRAWAARHGLSSDQYQQAFNELLTERLRLVQINGYPLTDYLPRINGSD